jgi:ATP-dependent Lon protease
MREMRKRNFSDAIDRWFKLGRDLNQRDTIAVRRTVSGLLKLLYPARRLRQGGRASVPGVRAGGRRRVKEQLKKIGGMEFFDVHFSYIDQETMEENLRQRAGAGRRQADPGRTAEPRRAAHRRAPAAAATSGCIGWRPRSRRATASSSVSGLGSNSAAKESVKVGFDYFKANANRVSMP